MQQTNSRFDFPGFEVLEQPDTETHMVEIGQIKSGGRKFILHLIMKKNLTFAGNFLVAKVFGDSPDPLWVFPREFSGTGVLVDVDGEPVITLISCGQKGRVQEVTPLCALVSNRLQDMRRQIALKRRAALILERNCHLNLNERRLVAIDQRRNRAAEDKERAQRRAERAEARRMLVADIRGRKRLTVYTAEGLPRHGYPVTANEWQYLSDGTFVVLVQSYTKEDGPRGEKLEAFSVRKVRGKGASKHKAAQVYWHQAVDGAGDKEMPQPSNTVLVEDGNRVFNIDVYADSNEVRVARRLGLNGGTLVTTKKDIRSDGKCTVYKVFHDGVRTYRQMDILEPIQ